MGLPPCARKRRREVRALNALRRGCNQTELLVLLLVFGLMWTCGGLALQAKLDDVRRFHGPTSFVLEVTPFVDPPLAPPLPNARLADERLAPRASFEAEASSTRVVHSEEPSR